MGGVRRPLATAGAILAFLAPTAGHGAALEWNFVVAQRLAVAVVNKECYLFVDGVSRSSATTVTGWEVVYDRDEARVLVNYAGPFGPAGSPEFHAAIATTNPVVRRVVFGPSKTTLWTADDGCQGMADGARRQITRPAPAGTP